MFQPRILHVDGITGKQTVFHVLPDGRFAVETITDVEPVLEQNKDLARLQRSDWKGVNHVASIPMPQFQALRAEGRVQDQKAFHRWLSDSDQAKLRVKRGRLG